MLSESEVEYVTDIKRVALRQRRFNRASPRFQRDPVTGAIGYEVEDAVQTAIKRGGKHAARVEEVRRTGERILASTRSAPLAHPELEQTAIELAMRLHRCGPVELAAKLATASDTAARLLGKASPTMKPETARTIRAGFVQRVGFLVSRLRGHRDRALLDLLANVDAFS